MSHVANVMLSVEPDDRPLAEELSRWLESDAPLRGRDGRTGWVGALRETTGADTRWGGGKFPECDVYAGALNHADLAALIARVEQLPWQQPGFVQLMVMDQEEVYFRVWMFHGPRLRLLTPAGREQEYWPGTGPADVHLRLALTTDAGLLRDLLTAGAGGAPDNSDNSDGADSRQVARRADGWPRPGDFGLVALSTTEESGWQPVPIGAAWFRHTGEQSGGRPGGDGNDGEQVGSTAELTVVLVPAHRGRGVGAQLLGPLLRAARAEGVGRLTARVPSTAPAGTRAWLRRHGGFRDLPDGAGQLGLDLS
ncbi:GNAT family N-acetyltransferase [Kitasatospora sp. NRRL B-11411]|uniref:GNAT family N-acetyltransferase n=1 Tax=Kitasatospora sp. NRRL B-11411 TaxID=1463822 RepID=UPI0007C48424|nr:GNAT family N-acetyltransferase [Kitasatospora sp. NRRL B-11411]